MVRHQAVIIYMYYYTSRFSAFNHITAINQLLWFNRLTGKQFSSSSTELLQSYLTNRSQFPSDESWESWSDSLMIACGVPQGSILGPILYRLNFFSFVKNTIHIFHAICFLFAGLISNTYYIIYVLLSVKFYHKCVFCHAFTICNS